MNINTKFFIVLLSCFTYTIADDMISANCITFNMPRRIECSQIIEYCQLILGANYVYFNDGSCTYHPNVGFTDFTEEQRDYTCCSI